MCERDNVIDKLLKLRARLDGKVLKFPPNSPPDCPSCGGDISFHLAGLFLKEHMGIIIEALRRLD